MVSIRDRVRVIPASELDSMQRTADAAIEELRDAYRTISRENVDRLQKLVQAPMAGEKQREEIYRLAHDLKGQGSTFGQDLVTIIATSLCKLIRGLGEATEDDFAKHAIAHCEAIRVILDKDIRGTGGDHGAALLRVLGIAHAS
jgi:chemotaxis protein histidine kinase CheA